MKQNKFHMAWMVAALLTMAGCSDEIENKQGENPIDSEGVFMTVNIATGVNTKAEGIGGEPGKDPSGGENGDGDLIGFDNENQIKSVTIVLYDGGDINNPGNVVASAYSSDVIDNSDASLNQHHHQATVKFNTTNLEYEKPYNVLAIVNADVREKYPAGTSLPKDETFDQYKTDDGFVMSTHVEELQEGGSQVSFSKTNSEESPDVATVKVERFAARVDYTGTKNTFEVMAGSSNGEEKIADVILNKVSLVNRAKHPIYIFKRVTVDNVYANNSTVLLGDEHPVLDNPGDHTSEAGQNYVIDPTIKEDIEKQFDNPFSSLETGNITEEEYKQLDNIINSEDEARVLGYMMENTMDKDDQLHGNTAGLIFQAIYTPVQLAAYDTEKDEVVLKKIEDLDYTKGTTFYKVYNVLYKDLMDAEIECIGQREGVSSTIQSTLMTLRKNINNANELANLTWKNLYEATNAFSKSVDLGYRLYLQEQIQGKENDESLIGNTSASELTWNAFSSAKIDNATWTQNELQVYTTPNESTTITRYENGQCYYQYWIRHANNGNPEEMGIMEFATVRNNVYQIAVTGVDRLGLPHPFDDVDEPNEGGDVYLQVTLYVKDWVIRNNGDITLK